MRGTLGIDPAHIILRRAKDYIKYSLLAHFRKGTNNFAGFMSESSKYEPMMKIGHDISFAVTKFFEIGWQGRVKILDFLTQCLCVLTPM